MAVRRIFDGAATQLQALLLTLQELLAALVLRLEKQESGIRGLRVEWQRCHAPPVTREFILSRASRDPKHLWQLLRPKVESMHMGYGVESVTLVAYWTQPIPHQQTSTLGHEDLAHDAAYHGLIDTLANRWGRQRVFLAHPKATHVPELARAFHPAGGVGEEEKVSIEETSAGDVLPVDRPALMLDPPEPAEAMALEPDHPPAWLKWRGQEYILSAGTGPERIVTCWWPNSPRHRPSTPPSTRDYFKVSTPAGTWLWIFRELESQQQGGEGSRGWFVHGLWV
jgi:protein ImuB